MNVKCPYCGCCYEITRGLLRDPIGSDKLGYGWWLRCCRCHRKWWLKNSFVEEFSNPKANNNEIVRKLSAFGKKRGKSSPTSSRKMKLFLKSVLLMFAIGILALGYHYRSFFYRYLEQKAQHLIESVSNKLVLCEVKYTIGGDTIKVAGAIVNDDERAIATINGIKVLVIDQNKHVITSWEVRYDQAKVLPQQKYPFSTEKKLPDSVNKEGLKVEVSVL